MRRAMVVAVILAVSLSAQMPKTMWAWWNNQVVVQKMLNLTPAQIQQIRHVVRQYRPHLIDVRAEVAKSEIDLETQFNHDPVDQTKATQAIERVVAARSDLTRTLSEMSLKMRVLLNEQQWQQLQRLRPTKDPGEQPAELPPQR